MTKALKADVRARAIELGVTTTLAGPTGVAVAQLIATEAVATAIETLLAQDVEDGPRIDKSLALTALALKAA